MSIVKAYKSVTNVIETLGGVKRNIVYYHNKWFDSAVLLATKVGINPKMPRVCSRSVYRANAIVPSKKSAPTIAKMVTAGKKSAKKPKSAKKSKSKSAATKESTSPSNSNDESVAKNSKDEPQSSETATPSNSNNESVAKSSNDEPQSEITSSPNSSTNGSAINNEESYFRRNLTVVCMDEV